MSEETKRRIGLSNKAKHPMKFYDHTCKRCGISFRTRQPIRSYCSNQCRRDNTLYNINCEICGDRIIVKTTNSKVCLKCRKKKCEICGKEFIVPSADILKTAKNRPRKYCSDKCYRISKRGTIPWNKESPTEITCIICNTKFNVWKSRLTRNVKYCSRKCAYEGLSLITNVNHPLWKGGHDLYSRLLSLNEGSFYRNRLVVLKRDNYTCQYCGHKGESRYMDVHHIIPVVENGTNLPSNLITLCRKCHSNADRGKLSLEYIKIDAQPVIKE